MIGLQLLQGLQALQFQAEPLHLRHGLKKLLEPLLQMQLISWWATEELVMPICPCSHPLSFIAVRLYLSDCAVIIQIRLKR